MLTLMDAGIVGSNKYGRYPKISAEETYNMIKTDSSPKAALVPYVGYRIAAQNIGGGGQCRFVFRSITYDHLIVIVGSSVYAVSKAMGVSTLAKNILKTEHGFIAMADNGINQVAIIDGTKTIYVFNYIDHDFETYTVPDGDTLTFIYIDYMDGRFIAADGATNQWRLSAFNDALTWTFSPQTVGQLQRAGDRPQATVVFGRQLFVMGSAITEIFHNVGTTLFPYQIDNSLGLNYGVVSRDSIAVATTDAGNILAWFGASKSASPAIMVSFGGAPKIITTDGIAYFLDTIKSPQDCAAFIFEQMATLFIT